jgi:uncharacterized protein YndB with AHSA1/START domain
VPVGKTKDAGWQIGVSITVGRPATEVWSRLTSPDGLAIWLGSGVELAGSAHQRYETSTGTTGEVRSHRPHDRIRLTWKPSDWDHDTTPQITLDDRGDRTGVRFHQERLRMPRNESNSGSTGSESRPNSARSSKRARPPDQSGRRINTPETSHGRVSPGTVPRRHI